MLVKPLYMSVLLFTVVCNVSVCCLVYGTESELEENVVNVNILCIRYGRTYGCNFSWGQCQM